MVMSEHPLCVSCKHHSREHPDKNAVHVQRLDVMHWCLAGVNLVTGEKHPVACSRSRETTQPFHNVPGYDDLPVIDPCGPRAKYFEPEAAAKRRDGADEFRRQYREAVDAGALRSAGYNGGNDYVWFTTGRGSKGYLTCLSNPSPELVSEMEAGSPHHAR